MGAGPATGRGAGFCMGFGAPGYANPVGAYDRGWARGLWCRGFSGAGRGWRHMFYATGLPGWMRSSAGSYAKPDPELEKQFLKSRAEALQAELDLIKKRLDQMDTQI